MVSPHKASFQGTGNALSVVFIDRPVCGHGIGPLWLTAVASTMSLRCKAVLWEPPARWLHVGISSLCTSLFSQMGKQGETAGRAHNLQSSASAVSPLLGRVVSCKQLDLSECQRLSCKMYDDATAASPAVLRML